MNLRPDERAALADIERSKKTDSLLKKGAGLAIGTGTAALGLGAASKIMPFLNEYIPVDLAIKGISKINPEIGKFLKKGQSLGMDMKEGLDFIKDKISPKEETKEAQETTTNQDGLVNFENEYPMLAKALMATIQQGKNPQEAARILKTSTALGKQVKNLETRIGKKFEDYVIEMLGNAQQSQAQPQQMQQPQIQAHSNSVDPQLLQLVQGLRNSIKGMRGG